MRLFRQKKPGDWDDVFTRMAEALRSDKSVAAAGMHARQVVHAQSTSASSDV